MPSTRSPISSPQHGLPLLRMRNVALMEQDLINSVRMFYRDPPSRVTKNPVEAWRPTLCDGVEVPA